MNDENKEEMGEGDSSSLILKNESEVDWDHIPFCFCGVPASQRKVLAETNNQGRLYYACSFRKCDYFEWFDDLYEVEIKLDSIQEGKEFALIKKRIETQIKNLDKIKNNLVNILNQKHSKIKRVR